MRNLHRNPIVLTVVTFDLWLKCSVRDIGFGIMWSDWKFELSYCEQLDLHDKITKYTKIIGVNNPLKPNCNYMYQSH